VSKEIGQLQAWGSMGNAYMLVWEIYTSPQVKCSPRQSNSASVGIDEFRPT